MLTLRLTVSLRSSRVGARSCIVIPNNRCSFGCLGQSSVRDNEVTILKIDNNIRASLNNNFTNLSYVKNLSNVELGSNCQIVRNYYSSESLPEKADSFGELADRKFEKVPLDEGEQEEEKFVENEAQIPRRLKPSPGRYVNLIKSHIQRKDLTAALEVLDLIKFNRDKPNVYMYNLLLRAFAVAGDFKKCKSLYARMKKRGLECNDATYTSLFNVCANYPHKEVAIQYLEDLRQELALKNVLLNETHYNVMIKAYGRHGEILQAFSLADEMRDKRLPTGLTTFNSLLIGTISNPKAGLRHALVVWHLMRRHAIVPTVTTYNLLLRAIRDTELGELKVNDVLIEAPPHCQVHLNNETKPDLLARPPVVNSLLFTEMALRQDPNTEKSEEASSEMEAPKKKKNAKKHEESTNLPAKVASDENSVLDLQSTIENTCLEKIHSQNRLVLFGGVTGILTHMENDGIVPDTKAMTILMELVPPSDEAERGLLQIAKARKIPLDIDFFNMLMKKRSFRKDYEGAKAILDDIQRYGLCPNIITWGILALSCHTLEDATTLMDGMKATGHRLNDIIAGTLINNACRKMRFAYILHIMNAMSNYRIQPNYSLYCTLDDFEKEIDNMVRNKKFTRTTNHPAFKAGAVNFKLAYKKWRTEMKNRDEMIKQEKRERRAAKKSAKPY